MRAAALVLLAALSVSSCATAQPFIDVGKACVGEANIATGNLAISEVNQALACALMDKSPVPACVQDGLKDLGAKWGSAALMCALEKIADAVSIDPNDTVAPVRRQRAKAALQRARVSWRTPDRSGSLASTSPGIGPGPGGG